MSEWETLTSYSPHFTIYCSECATVIRSCECKVEFKDTEFEVCKECKVKLESICTGDGQSEFEADDCG